MDFSIEELTYKTICQRLVSAKEVSYVMVNINGKDWNKLQFSDIEAHLETAENETLFFEYKQDDEKPSGLAKEVSAFANTYGGYIIIGVADNKNVMGCSQWDENRVHTTIHELISPSPIVDVKTLTNNGMSILVLKIEEGQNPPYITNRGAAFERVSSGSYPIKDSGKLSHLYNKRQDQIVRIKNKIELGSLVDIKDLPNNICGCIDIGFSLTCNAKTKLYENFPNNNADSVAAYIRKQQTECSISLVGYSYHITVGRITITTPSGEEVFTYSDINNFMEIMLDGSVRIRVILSNVPGQTTVNISVIVALLSYFEEVYRMMVGPLEEIFVEAYKYERLQVVKQFVPVLYSETDKTNMNNDFVKYLRTHKNKYGNNLVVTGNRIPYNDYQIIDRYMFDASGIEYNNDNLLKALFESSYITLGYIDPPEISCKEE